MYKLIYLARRNPQVSREDWPRTWRSHAIFASQFPVLEAKIEYMRYCNRIDRPMLDGESVDLPCISTAHDGVAVAGSESLEGLDGADFSEADRALIDKDELRVFDMLTPNFTYYCTENVLREGKPGEAALFRFLRRSAETTRDDFDLCFDGDYAGAMEKAIEGVDCVTRYVHNRPVHEPRPLFHFDGIAECWFASVEDAVRTLRDGGLNAVVREVPHFCDAAGAVTLLTSVCHRWPKD